MHSVIIRVVLDENETIGIAREREREMERRRERKREREIPTL